MRVPTLLGLTAVVVTLAVVAQFFHVVPLPTDLVMLTLLGVGIGSVNDTIAQDRNSPFSTDSVRAQHDLLLKDAVYALLNRPAWQVAAAAVAPPLCARGGTASKVKTTATTQCYIDGVPLSLTATDDLWTLTGANLAAGSVRKYLLLWDGATATTVVSVLQSNDVVIATSPLATSASALAQCRFPSLPPKNATGGSNVVVGILSIVNTTNAFIPATTLLSATGVTDTYRDGPDANVFQSSILSP